MKNEISYSKIIAGAMSWGSWGKQLSTTEMSSLMIQCLELGITTFDHADIYGGYSTEEAFGKAFEASEIAREGLQLITKCGIQYLCEARENRVKHYNYSEDYIIWSAERSLKGLRADYIDLFLLHRPSPLMEPEEVASAITKLKDSGKIRQFGVSNFSPSQIALLETAIPVEGNQVEFSLTANQVMFDGTLDDCVAKRRIAMAWSPLGAYFRENNEQVKRIRPEMEKLQEKYGATDSQLLLAWMMKHPSGIRPVVGTTNLNRLEESVKAAEIELELEDWFILLTASQGHKVP